MIQQAQFPFEHRPRRCHIFAESLACEQHVRWGEQRASTAEEDGLQYSERADSLSEMLQRHSMERKK